MEKKVKVNIDDVGRKTLTKKVGVDDDESPDGLGDAMSLTEQYKFPEGSKEERMQVANAAKTGGVSLVYDIPSREHEDVEFKVIHAADGLLGKDFGLTLSMTNKNDSARTVAVSIHVNSIYYTGIIANLIKSDLQDIHLEAHETQTINMSVSADEYAEKLVEFALLKIYVMAQVNETQQIYSEEADFSFDKPSLALNLKAEGNVLKVGQSYDLDIGFTNPLNLTLTEASFSLESPNLTSGLVTFKVKDVKPFETVNVVRRLTAKKVGETTVVVVFNSNQLIDVNGFKNVKVEA